MTPYAFGEKVAAGWGTLAKTIGRAATRAPVNAAIKKLPQAYQPAVNNIRRAVNYGTLGATGYGAYRGVQTAAGDMSTAAAQQMGVNDPKVLQEVNTRAQQNAFPMLYRSVMPAALGGDNTAVGQNAAKAIGTAAYHNLRPQTLLPAHNPTALQYATSSPVTNVARHLLPKRPSGAQMLANIPQADRTHMATSVGGALMQPQTTSPLAKQLQHVFEPAVNYKQQQMFNMLGMH